MIRTRVPAAWLEALRSAAEIQGISVSALVRLQLGPFVRKRLEQ